MITLTAQAVVCPKLANTQSNKILCMNDFIKVNSKGVQPSVACFFLGYRQVTCTTTSDKTIHALRREPSGLLVPVVRILAVFRKREQEPKAQYLYIPSVRRKRTVVVELFGSLISGDALRMAKPFPLAFRPSLLSVSYFNF
jgi:hypothetical protein